MSNLKIYDAYYVLSQANSPITVKTAASGEEQSKGLATIQRFALESINATEGTISIEYKYFRGLDFIPLKNPETQADILIDLADVAQRVTTLTQVGDIQEYKFTLTGLNGTVHLSIAGWQGGL